MSDDPKLDATTFVVDPEELLEYLFRLDKDAYSYAGKSEGSI